MDEVSGARVAFQQGDKVILRIAGDLFLRGWDEHTVLVFPDDSRHARVQQGAGMVTITADDDAWLNLPADADVRIEHVGGDANLSGLRGSVEIQHISGDLVVLGAGKVDVAQVGGDATLLTITGPLTIRRVGGDLVGDVSGGLSVDMVGGDSDVRVKGGARLRSGGDIVISLEGVSTEEVVLKSGCDIKLHVPADISARMDLTSGSEDIVVDILNQHRSMKQKDYILTVGDGGRMVRAKSGCDIMVTDEPIHAIDLAGETSRYQAHWEHRAHAGHAREWSHFDERISKRAEEAARRAEERVKAAMERVERHRERSYGKWGKWFGIFGLGEQDFQHPKPPEPPVEPSSTQTVEAPSVVSLSKSSDISNEERMLVLKMLQEHKITVEEAEELLAALEGQIE